MKKIILLLGAVLMSLNFACSSDDSTKPVIDPVVPPVDFNKEIQKKWEFTTYQLLDKDKKVIKEYKSQGENNCKNSIWEFKEEVDEDKTIIKVRYDYTYFKDSEDSEALECDEQMKRTPYNIIEKNILFIVILDDGDQLVPFNFSIREITKEQMLLIREDFKLTEEEAIEQGFPKETRYLQYQLKVVK